MTPITLSAPLFRLKRKARRLARREGLSHTEALDRLARAEGFRNWSHLSARHREADPARQVLAALAHGDLVLVGARPEQGKTLLSLGLAAEAARLGRPAHIFTLDYTEADVVARLREIGADPRALSPTLRLDTSDGICAAHIGAALAEAAPGTVAVIDYLQLLDQRREHPPLGEQIPELRRLARSRGAILLAVSQIDRRFDGAKGPMPGLEDVRLPNPADLTLFDKACFLADGEIRLEAVAA